MRYPRVFFVFKKPEILPDEEYFQSISNSPRKVYLSKISDPIQSIDQQIEIILDIDSFLKHRLISHREVLVISHPKIFDFLGAYFSDKDLAIYWLDSKHNLKEIVELLGSYDQLQIAKDSMQEVCYHYFCGLNRFVDCTDRYPHPQDDVLYKLRAIAYGDMKTVLESELRVLLNNKLSMGNINRIDLS
jgi:hypothetical protein